MAPKKKRKYSSSVAAAARDALYSSSSDSSSSSEDDSDSDDESEQSSSSSEEDEPIRKKKKVSASSKSITTSKKSTINHTTNTKAKYSRRHLKPLFEKGDRVFSAWWKDEKRSGETQWYPGLIKSYTQEETNSPYGPTRYYDIDFDDGDELYKVEDYYVFPEVDYILQQKNDFKPNWIGVKNVTDKSVKGDRWPGDVGWYVANLGDGKESEHARLSDAMDAYDNHIVQTRGKKTKKSELNRPKKWGWLFATSDSESEGDNIKKKKRKRSKKKKKKKKEEEPSIRKKVKSAFEAMVQPSAPPPPPPKVKEKSSKSPPPTKGLKTPSSNYKGVSHSKQDKKYLALIEYGGKLHSLGYYKLESDAALAYDKGSIVLLSDADSPNFSTRQAYEKAIRTEVEETDPLLDVEESYKDVVKKVEVYLSNIYAGEKKTYDMELEDDEGSEEDSDEDDSDEEISDDKKESVPTIKKKKGTSIYTGVYYHSQTEKWKSQVCHTGKRPHLGEYELEADATLAYDEVVKLLGGSTEETNFATFNEYEKAKKDELARTGISSGAGAKSPAAIKSKMTEIVRKNWPSFESSTFKRFKKKKNTSNYVGVSFRQETNKWRSSISHGSMQQRLGNYNLEVDAAFAFDEAAKLLRGPNAETNFATLKDYENAKKLELEKTGMSSDAAMSPTAIKAKVAEVIRKNCPATSIQDGGSSRREVNTDKQQKAVTPKKKTSDYAGVYYHKTTKKWMSQAYDGTTVNLGRYKLQADAALAFDEAVKQLKGPTAKTNFSSLEDYEKAKKQELKETGLGSDALSSASIISKISDIVSKHSRGTTIYDGGSSKRESDYSEEQNFEEETSNYVGVYKHRKKWKAQVTHNRGKIHIGHYTLQADAAFAFDETVKQLRGSTAKTNFSSLVDYELAKKQELRKTGLGSDVSMSSSAITSDVLKALPSKYRGNKKVSSTKKRPSGNRTSSAHQQSKHSDYIGVTYNNSTQAFESEIKHGRRKHHVGHWNLQSDAALAYDEACKLMNGEDCSDVNFASDQSYLDARSNEISKLFGSSVTIEPISSITTEIKRQLSKIPSPELDALNDAMAAKWSRYLPSATGNDFMALYQQSMGKLLGMTTSHQSEQHDTASSIVSGNNVGTKSAKDTEVPEGGFKPISDSGPKDMKSSQPQPEVQDESDDEASLFSGNDTEEEEEEADAVVNTSDKVKAGAQSVQNGNTASSSSTQKEPNTTDFPIDCPVMWNMNDNSFNCGTVSSKLTKGKQYEVVDKEKSNSKLVPAESLLFGIDCPVNVAPSCDDKSPLLQGKVLMYTKKSYTILINKEGNQIEVMTGVTQDRVTFRRVEVESSAPQPNKIVVASKNNDEFQKETPPSQQPQAEKPRWQPPTPRNKAVEDNDNSTITSLDSAQASSRRQLATGSIPRKQGDNDVENIDCRIYFPHWLIPDTASRQRLFSHLVNASNVMNLQQIGMKTNCTLRLIEGVTTGNPHVLIMSSLINRKYAIDDVRKATSDLEDALLEYIRQDGSKGRLFYDLAWKCKLLHPRGGTHSTVVQQRNPFSPNKEMMWVNIVELPYSGGFGQKKQYHSRFVFDNKSLLLAKIKRMTSGCMIQVCHNGARSITNLCSPYVFAFGKTPAQVDKAVEILQNAIQQHMSECGCRLNNDHPHIKWT